MARTFPDHPNLKTPVGFSLVEMLVATGIAGVLALTIATIFGWSIEGQRTIQQRQAAMSVQLGVTGLLGDRAICALNFHTVNAGAAPVAVTQIFSSRSPAVVVVEVGKIYENNMVRLAEVSLGNFRPYATSGPDSHRGILDLNLRFEPVSSGLGAIPMLRTVNLLVETNAFPPVTAGPADQIRGCVALGGDQNSIWTLKPNGEIYYVGFNVGIGTNAPAQMLEVNGNVLATAYLHSSDARLKENVRPAPGLAALAQLRGVRFAWKRTHEPALGVLAQDVERVFPEAVRTDPRTHLKSVSYQQLIGPLIESVNELARENRALEAEVDRLARVRR